MIVTTEEIIEIKAFMLKSNNINDWNNRRDEAKQIIATKHPDNPKAIKEILYHIDARKWIKELNFPSRSKQQDYEQ